MTAARSRSVRALAQVHAGAVSFDVFDTLLWRRYPRPIDVFHDIPRAAVRAGLKLPHIDAVAFATSRRQAEEDARVVAAVEHGTSEVTIDQIYRQMAVIQGWDSDDDDLVAALIRAEIEAEADAVFADHELVDVVSALAGEGRRLLVVSDTYLSVEHVARLLAAGGYPAGAFERIFVSSAYGASKSGGLFDVMLNELGLKPPQLMHIGDLPGADVAPLRGLGGRTVRWPVAKDEAIALIESEAGNSRLPIRRTILDGDATSNDAGLTAMRARLVAPDDMRDARERIVSGYEQFGRLVYGPSLTGFLVWVCDRARHLGLRRLYLFQREGPFLRGLTELLTGALDLDIELQVLDVSRAALAPARTPEVSVRYVRDLVTSRRPRRGDEVFDDLGLTGLTLGPWSADRRLTHADAEPLYHAIVGDHDAKVLAQQRLDERRENVYRHVRQTMDLTAASIGVVDLGWAASIQRSLFEAMTHLGFDGVMDGFYLATNAGALANVGSRNRVEGFLANNGQPEGLEPLFRNLEIIEQCCLAPIASVRHYDGAGTPVRARNDIDAHQWKAIARIQDGAKAFVDEWVAHPQLATQDRLADDVEVWRHSVRDVLGRFAQSPSRSEIELFRSWRHDDNKGASSTEQLIPKIFETRGRGRAMLADRLGMDELLWSSAVSTLNAPVGDIEELTIVADLADKAIGEHVPSSRAVALKSDDTVAVYVGGDARRPSSVRMRIACGPAIVRLAAVSVELESDDETIAEELTAWRQLKLGRGAKALSRDLAVVKGQMLRVTVPVGDIGARLRSQQRVRVLLELEVDSYLPNPNPVVKAVTARGEGVARLALSKGMPAAMRIARTAGVGGMARKMLGELGRRPGGDGRSD